MQQDPSIQEAFRGESAYRRAIVALSVTVCAVALAGLGSLYFWVLYTGVLEGVWLPIFRDHFLMIGGIPIAVIVAAGVVQFFRGVHGPVEIKIPGVQFSGATGPVLLWILCFLAIAWAIKYLWSQGG
jgi:hypothetical protein